MSDLPHADVGMQPFRTLLRDLHPDEAARGVAEYEDLVLAELFAQPGDHLFGIGDHALLRHRRRDRLGIIGDVSLARPALVPMHDREVLLPPASEIPAGRHHRKARSAVDKKKDRIATKPRTEIHWSMPPM
jgi:hypothetical protein